MRIQENLGVYADRCDEAADTLQKYVTALDKIYNHNEAARAAVLMHFGMHHTTAIAPLERRREGNRE